MQFCGYFDRQENCERKCQSKQDIRKTNENGTAHTETFFHLILGIVLFNIKNPIIFTIQKTVWSFRKISYFIKKKSKPKVYLL